MSPDTDRRCHECGREYAGANGGLCGGCGRPTCLACFARLAVLDDPCQNGTECVGCAREAAAATVD